MCDQKYQQRLKKLLDFDLKVLKPWKTEEAPKKMTKLFQLFYFSSASFVMMLLTFNWYQRNYLTFFTKIENAGIAMSMFRSVLYILMMQKYHSSIKVQLDKMFDDRTLLPSNQDERLLTEALCRREYRSVFFAHCFVGVTGSILFHVFAYLFPNDYHLTFNCYLIFLPPGDEFSFAWELNMMFMIFVTFFSVLFFICYMHLPLLLMNQTCWLLDLALMTAEQMNTDLQPDDEISDHERAEKTNDHLKKFVERCEKIVEWRKEVQDLLHWNFNIEFQIQSILLCLTIYVLTVDLFASYMVENVFLICLAQLFVYCWMGTRITTRYDQLSFEISKNWYLMQPKQRKDVQLIVHWTQNMDGFTGTFKDVSLATFQSILEASYTFYTLLRSVNG